MNILQLQDRMKGLPDTALQTAASMPGEHQFLAVAELAERQRIRGAYANQAQQAQPTVAQRIMGGNPVAPVESPRADIGGLAAASNRGELQPALGMYSGGAVPSPYYMQTGGPTPPAPKGSGLAKELDTKIVQEQRRKAQEVEQMQPPAQQELPGNLWGDQVAGTGVFSDSRGQASVFRNNLGGIMDQYEQAINAAAPEDRIAPLLAAQEQDRARNAEMEKRDRWLALAQAGVGMAAGNSPDFLTNVVGGAQAGLGALRGSMTEAEKRQAGLQARGDALEKARMEQEAQQAEAIRRGAGLRAEAEGNFETSVFTQAMRANEAQRTIEAEEARLKRKLSSDEKQAIWANANRIQTTAMSERAANFRAQKSAEYQAASDERQRDITLQKSLNDVPSIISDMVKTGEILPAKAAEATRALRAQIYIDAGREPPGSVAAALPGRNRGEPKEEINRGPTGRQ